MYSYIKGIIAENTENSIILENNGIGYEIFMGGTALSKCANSSGEILIYTYLQVKEDAHILYGFLTKGERNMFLKLIEVSGVGCKLALQIIGGSDFETLALNIACGDAKALSSIKGVGKKTAERIILELKEKVDMKGITLSDIQMATDSSDRNLNDAIAALISLGISKAIAVRAVAEAAKEESQVDKIIAKALRKMDR